MYEIAYKIKIKMIDKKTVKMIKIIDKKYLKWLKWSILFDHQNDQNVQNKQSSLRWRLKWLKLTSFADYVNNQDSSMFDFLILKNFY